MKKMIITIGDIVVSVACFTILHCIWKTIDWIWFKPRRLEKQLRQQGLGGNSYKLLYGDHKEGSKSRTEITKTQIPFTNDYFPRVFPHFHQLNNKYGENSFAWVGPTPFIHITDPKLINDAISRIHEFQKVETSPLVYKLFCGLVSYEGDKWESHRKLLNPAFQLDKLKFMLPTFRTSINDMVNKWERLLSETSSSSCEIDVCPYFTSMTADAITRTSFGSTYEDERRTFELITQQQLLLAPLINSIYIPGWQYMGTKTNKRIKEKNAAIEKLMKKLVDKKEKAMNEGKGSTDDLLGILIESSKQNNNKNKNNNKSKYSINYEELIDDCKLFFFSGHETTSSLLAWTILLLSKHQDWQTRARLEILETFGMNPPDYQGLHRLKIMKMILNEVLRLYPPVPSLTRGIRAGDTRLVNLHLPKGIIVNLSLIHAHHNPKYWGDDAKEFKPERFSEGVGKATKGNMSFFPFGGGPRICIGQNLALIEAKMALSIILQKFEFQLSSSYIHAPISLITLKPQHGAHVILPLSLTIFAYLFIFSKCYPWQTCFFFRQLE